MQDVFSLGCVIAELWLGEGRAFFDLGTLLAYRRGEYDPSKELAAIEPDIAELVLHMIHRAPGEATHQTCRWCCLHRGRYTVELHMAMRHRHQSTSLVNARTSTWHATHWDSVSKQLQAQCTVPNRCCCCLCYVGAVCPAVSQVTAGVLITT